MNFSCQQGKMSLEIWGVVWQCYVCDGCRQMSTRYAFTISSLCKRVNIFLCVLEEWPVIARCDGRVAGFVLTACLPSVPVRVSHALFEKVPMMRAQHIRRCDGKS